MDAGNILAGYAAVLSTVSAFVVWLSWRRVPRSSVELRAIKTWRADEGTVFSCIAANRSPHAVELTTAVARCGWEGAVPAGITSTTTSRQPFPRVVTGGPISRPATYTEPAPGPIVTTVVAVALAPDGGAFPLIIPPGQGRTLKVTVPGRESTVSRGMLTVEVSMSDGLTFSRSSCGAVAIAGRV
jgi:hypothetical protein